MHQLDLARIKRAADRLQPYATRTPLLQSDRLDEITGARVFLKAENLQRGGSFKFRGATNAIAAFSPDQRSRGVVCCSSGNHGIATALAAQLFGIPATVVMPLDAPSVKRQQVERAGAAVVGYDRIDDDRDVIAAELCVQSGASFVHPYDETETMAGQGTVGLEIVEQLAALDLSPDVMLVCCGGGGLTAGIVTVLADVAPWCRCWVVEPTGFDDYARSLTAGTRIGNTARSGSICDALLAPMPGALTFAVNQPLLSGGFAVDDAAVLAAMAFGITELKVVLEPGGAVALAALLAGKVEGKGQVICATLSGGNADAVMVRRALA
jgi:threonine dehydratase